MHLCINLRTTERFELHSHVPAVLIWTLLFFARCHTREQVHVSEPRISKAGEAEGSSLHLHDWQLSGWEWSAAAAAAGGGHAETNRGTWCEPDAANHFSVFSFKGQRSRSKSELNRDVKHRRWFRNPSEINTFLNVSNSTQLYFCKLTTLQKRSNNNIKYYFTNQ